MTDLKFFKILDLTNMHTLFNTVLILLLIEIHYTNVLNSFISTNFHSILLVSINLFSEELLDFTKTLSFYILQIIASSHNFISEWFGYFIKFH